MRPVDTPVVVSGDTETLVENPHVTDTARTSSTRGATPIEQANTAAAADAIRAAARAIRGDESGDDDPLDRASHVATVGGAGEDEGDVASEGNTGRSVSFSGAIPGTFAGHQAQGVRRASV